MAHFAELDENNIVLRVIVVSNDVLMDENGNEVEQRGIDFCHNLLGGNWKQTSYNAKFRKNYAGEGFTYDAQRDAFISPKAVPSWVLNEETCRWEPPFPPPNDGKEYRWDEDTISWVEIAQ